MLIVSNEATEALKEIMAERDLDSPVRVFAEQSCGGAVLALGVDEAREGDETTQVEGLTFLLDRDLGQVLGEVKVHYLADAAQPGFTIDSDNPPPHLEGGCGGGCC